VSGDHPSLSVAICTRNRPQELAACIEHALADPRVAEVLVSSDGVDVETDAVVDGFRAQDPRVRFLRGRRQGLAANRNECIANCRTDYVLFLDDDARLDPAFLDVALPRLSPQHLVTGWEDQNGRRIVPVNASFFGHQRVPNNGRPRSIVVNATIFPVAFLARRPFDEFYRFGAEEIDMALAACSAGLSIVMVDGGNLHFHVESARGGNGLAFILSNTHFCVRRYADYERDYAKLALYLALGPAQTLRALLRLPEPPGLAEALALTVSTLRSGFAKGTSALPRAVPDADRLPQTTVVVRSRGDVGRLRACLAALRAQHAAPVEIVVAWDHGGRPPVLGAQYAEVRIDDVTGATALQVWTRGMASARGAVVAFVDEDVVPRRDWTSQLGAAFGDPAVSAVTGPEVELGPEGARVVEADTGPAGRSGRPRPSRRRPASLLLPAVVAASHAGFRRASFVGPGGGIDSASAPGRIERDGRVLVERAAAPGHGQPGTGVPDAPELSGAL